MRGLIDIDHIIFGYVAIDDAPNMCALDSKDSALLFVTKGAQESKLRVPGELDVDGSESGGWECYARDEEDDDVGE